MLTKRQEGFILPILEAERDRWLQFEKDAPSPVVRIALQELQEIIATLKPRT